jgi:hypothetical protein
VSVGSECVSGCARHIQVTVSGCCLSVCVVRGCAEGHVCGGWQEER